MNWVILAGLTLIFSITPFFRGLYFSQDTYLVSFFLCLGFIVTFILKNKNNPNHYLWLFALPFIYYLTFFTSESPASNIDNLIIWLSFICFFILMLFARRNQQVEKLLSYIFHLAGASIAIFALFGVWGWTSYQDVVLGDRTTGPFQYANTFAAVVGAFWIYALILLARRKLPWYSVVIYSAPLIAYGVSFFHSYSRGGILVFAIVWFMGLLLLRTAEQVRYGMYSAVSVIGSLFAFRWMVSQEQSTDISSPGLAGVIAATLCVIGISLLMYIADRKPSANKMFEMLNAKRLHRFILPAFVFVCGIFLWLDLANQGLVFKQLPETLQHRISNITVGTGSVSARTTMYADALKMSADAPILGLGGDGWRTRYISYQSAPYLSNEIHNGYLEILLNTGWIGLLLFFGAFIFLLWQIVNRLWADRAKEEYSAIVAILMALGMLFIHAAIDFDFSYGTVWFIIFWLFAMGVPQLPVWPSSLRKVSEKIRPQSRAILVRSAQVIIVAGVLTGGVFAYRFYLADREAALAKGTIDIQEGMRIFNYATDKNPYSIRNWVGKANVYSYLYQNNRNETDREQVVEALNRIERLEPNNPFAMISIAKVYSDMGEFDRANEYLKKALENDRFNVNAYEALIQNHYLRLQQVANAGEFESATDIAAELVEHYEAYLAWYNEWKDEFVPDRRPIKMDQHVHFMAGESFRILNQYKRGLAVFKSQGVVVDSSLMNQADGELLDIPFEVISLEEIINQYKNQIMILSVRDEATSNLSEASKIILRQLGSNIDELKYRGSYLSIINEGELVFEEINNEGPVNISYDSASQKVREVLSNKPFKLHSSGHLVGNRSSIVVNEKEYSLNGRGINIVIFNTSMEFIGAYHFDTYLSDLKVIPAQ